MDLIIDEYLPEATSQSLLELRKFTKWQKENNGEWANIIGGWAVWAYYEQGLGSRDIDLVLPRNDHVRSEIFNSYFPNNNIDKKAKNVFETEVYYAKDITFLGKTDEIIFDLFYPENFRPDNDGLDFTIKWQWMLDYSITHPVGNDCFIQIPCPELLLPTKMVAALSRIEELKHTSDISRKQSKIWKDYYDVGILSGHIDFDWDHLERHMKNIGFTRDLVTRFLDGYISRADSLEYANTTLIQVADKIPPLR